ncbi:MAG: nucleotidyl transferase AbiEii/AbiGii toxin family protein [Phycisphaerae bacterium]
MSVSRAQLLKEAKATGYRPEILEKVIHLLELLEGFQNHPFLKDRIALKGGTAINLFIFDVPRLSVDIDLNYIGAVDRDTMLLERPKLEQAMQAVCGRAGMTATRTPTEEHAGGKWRLRYNSSVNDTGTLAVDLNFMLRVPLWPVVRQDSRRLGSYQALGIPILDVHELAAGKLAALFSRHASRDLFDAYGLVCGTETLDWHQLRIGFIVYGAMNRKDWRTLRLEDLAFDRHELENELLPVLRQADASRSLDELGDRLSAGCREKLAPLLVYTDQEQEFLDRLLDHGEIAAALLTADAALAARITAHPMLLWKAMNVKHHQKKP